MLFFFSASFLSNSPFQSVCVWGEGGYTYPRKEQKKTLDFQGIFILCLILLNFSICVHFIISQGI